MLFTLYNWGNYGPEKSSSLQKVTQKPNYMTELWFNPGVSDFKSCAPSSVTAPLTQTPQPANHTSPLFVSPLLTPVSSCLPLNLVGCAPFFLHRGSKLHLIGPY